MGTFAPVVLLVEVLLTTIRHSSRVVLDNINLTIHAGQKVFICGETGRYAIPPLNLSSKPFP